MIPTRSFLSRVRLAGLATLSATAFALAVAPAQAAPAPTQPAPAHPAPTLVVPASDLVALSGYPFPVRASPGEERRAHEMAAKVASTLTHFATRLGITPEIELRVLAERDWATHANFPVYGMPHITGGRTLIVASQENPFWRENLPDLATLPEPVADAVRAVYGDGRGGLRGAPFFDLLAIHELGHAYVVQAGVPMQRNWMGEFFPNVMLHAWVEEAAPEHLPALTLLPDVMVAQGSGDFEFTRLADIEERIGEVVGRNPANYGWFQMRWHQGARRVYRAAGSEVLDRLWDALRETPNRLDDEAFLALLDTRVHLSLGHLVRSWDPETAAPPPVQIGRDLRAATRPGALGAPPLPVIDVHFHAVLASSNGPAPLAMCTPAPVGTPWDPATGSMSDVFFRWQKEPPCADPVWSLETDEAVMRQALGELERLNVYGVTSGPASLVRLWRNQSPERVLPGLTLQLGPGQVPLDTLRSMHARGDLAVLGEVTTQYQGIHPADPALAPYWALAEELDIPVGIHVGTGPPGVVHMGADGYRGSLHSALTMEEVLVRHPSLRVYLMHAGFPMLDDALTVLYAHPQVYVDVGVIVFTQPRPAFYRFLEGLVDAGFGERILFGSDQMVWAGVLERAIAVIEEAPFLTEGQKRDILYNNAARFLRLSPDEIARHHAGTEGAGGM
jgi:uncharacterized protein